MRIPAEDVRAILAVGNWKAPARASGNERQQFL